MSISHIERKLGSRILADLGDMKAVILLGARQVGKTTLLKSLLSDMNVLWLDADEVQTQAILETPSLASFERHFSGYQIIVIDEAQRVKDIGVKLKLVLDHLPQFKLLVTGSSSFELSNKVNEPLTGRKWEHHLFPLSYSELVAHHGVHEEYKQLETRLIFGSFPEVVTSGNNMERTLKQLGDSILFKDILMWSGIKKSDKLVNLLRALALQLGNEISYNELGRTIGLDNETVEQYIRILEQSFIIYRLPALSRNVRTELKRSRKVYFIDNGMRNSLIGDFRPLSLRRDIGALWENYIISERRKILGYEEVSYQHFFWRTQSQQEIDLIEDRAGQLHAIEMKWSNAKQPRLSKTFERAYPDHTYQVISPENYGNFLSKV